MGAAAVAFAACGAPDERPPDAPAGLACATDLERPEGLLVAGSGSALALARAVARSYEERHPGRRVRIPESIGTRGAVRAVAEGAVAAGLASRPLRDDERALGIVETKLARSIVGVVVNKEVRVGGLTTAELADIYRGRVTTWPDGQPVVPLLREEGDSSNLIVRRALPALWDAMEDARASGRGVTCFTDQEMRDSLMAIEGAVGLLDVGMVHLERLPLRPVALDGVAPTREEAASGRYPLVKDLTLLTRGAPSPDVVQFLDFLDDPEVDRAMESGAYLRP
jgi:phosphate transport system substrate-binding protein